MQKNNLKEAFYLLFVMCFFQISGNAQIIDVFQNKEYDFSTYLLEGNSDKEYVPSKFEIYQDKNKEENKQWQNIENQLKTIALQQIENEVAFFQLHTKAVNYLKQLDELKRIVDPYHESSNISPDFTNIEISLVSVVNNQGTYYIQYNFDDVYVKDYYLADYQSNKIIAINKTPYSNQQKILRELTLNRLTAIYLIQTKKLDLDNVERIRATQSGEESLSDFSNRIDYSEALVYPYFSGIMVEFPANSKSSSIYDNKAFRTLLKGNELHQLLEVYPEFKPIFRQPLKKSSETIIKDLDDDDNFDLSRFSRAPKELQLWKTLNLSDTNPNVFSLTINNYQQSDTVKRFIGSKKYFFNKNGKVTRAEERNDRNNLAREEKYNYNEKNQLMDVRLSGYGNKLKLNNYENNLLSYTENIEINDYKTAWGKELVDLDISQQHFAYNNNHRYALAFNVVGDFDRNRTIQNRYISSNEYCTDHFCLLTNDSGQVVAVKKKTGSPIDILMNEKNQPIESYLDNDRYRYYFTYDDSDRIKTFSSISDSKNTSFVEYQYHKNIEKPLTITETKTSHSTTIIIQEYEIAFWED